MTDFSIFVRHAFAEDSDLLFGHRELSKREATQYRGSSLLSATNPEASITLVAGVGTTVMGSLVTVSNGTGKWSIDFVFVEVACREIGIGDALVVACLRELQQKNATWVQSSALPGDRAMKNLFERHGLVAQTIIVGKKL